MKEIEEKVKEIITNILSEEHKSIDFDNNDKWRDIEFYADMNLDSLKIVEIIMECEHKFNITISDGEIMKIKNIDNLITIIKDKTK